MDVVRKVEQVATDKENDEPVEIVSHDKFIYSRSHLDFRLWGHCIGGFTRMFMK